MRLLLVFGVLLVIANCVVFNDDSDSDSDSSSHESYSGGHHEGHRGGNKGSHPGGNHGGHNGGRPPRPNRPPGRPSTRCESGWTRINRQSGGWCVRIFAGKTNQPESEAICNSNGATLSAVESQKEREIVAELGKTYMTTTTSWRQGSLRFGIQRSSVYNPFLPTDGNSKGVAGITWTGGEPTPGNQQFGYNNCVLMWLLLPGGTQVEQRRHGEFFSKVCHMTWDGAFRGFVCGKVAR